MLLNSQYESAKAFGFFATKLLQLASMVAHEDVDQTEPAQAPQKVVSMTWWECCQYKFSLFLLLPFRFYPPPKEESQCMKSKKRMCINTYKVLVLEMLVDIASAVAKVRGQLAPEDGERSAYLDVERHL